LFGAFRARISNHKLKYLRLRFKHTSPFAEYNQLLLENQAKQFLRVSTPCSELSDQPLFEPATEFLSNSMEESPHADTDAESDVLPVCMTESQEPWNSICDGILPVNHSNDSNLPPGWHTIETVRQNGLTAGRKDKYYINGNTKCRSKKELYRYIEQQENVTPAKKHKRNDDTSDFEHMDTTPTTTAQQHHTIQDIVDGSLVSKKSNQANINRVHTVHSHAATSTAKTKQQIELTLLALLEKWRHISVTVEANSKKLYSNANCQYWYFRTHTKCGNYRNNRTTRITITESTVAAVGTDKFRNYMVHDY
jgi:hypothetical protein